MCTFYEAFSGLGRISAGFATRLVHAGALTALMRLAASATALEQRAEAAGHGAGADAGDPSAHSEEAQWGQECYAVFARAVPQVSRWVHFVEALTVGACLVVLAGLFKIEATPAVRTF